MASNKYPDRPHVCVGDSSASACFYVSEHHRYGFVFSYMNSSRDICISRAYRELADRGFDAADIKEVQGTVTDI